MHSVRRLLGTLLVCSAPLATAEAQIRFTAVTTGCFGAACTPGTVPGTVTDATGFLRFTSHSFDVETEAGEAAIGGEDGHLGTFAFLGGSVPTGAGIVNFGGQAFTLRVTFTSPAGVAVAPGAMDFLGTVSGTVNTANGLTRGGPRILFTETTRDFGFVYEGVAGTGTLDVQDLVSVSPGGYQTRTTTADGYLTASVVPEPASVALLGTGVAVLALAGLRRRRATA